MAISQTHKTGACLTMKNIYEPFLGFAIIFAFLFICGCVGKLVFSTIEWVLK